MGVPGTGQAPALTGTPRGEAGLQLSWSLIVEGAAHPALGRPRTPGSGSDVRRYHLCAQALKHGGDPVSGLGLEERASPGRRLRSGRREPLVPTARLAPRAQRTLSGHQAVGPRL